MHAILHSKGCPELGHNNWHEEGKNNKLLSLSYKQKIFKNYFCTVDLKTSKKEYSSSGDRSKEEGHI